jgi:hypothetical protein
MAAWLLDTGRGVVSCGGIGGETMKGLLTRKLKLN